MSSVRKIGGHVSIAGGLPLSLDRAEKIGANCLQIFAASPRAWARSPFPADQVKQFNQSIKEKGFRPVFIHALYLINLVSPDKNIFTKSVTALKSDLHSGQLIDSAGVVVHLGSHQGRGFDPVSTQLVDTLKDVLHQTKDTPLLMENTAGQKGKIGTLEELSFLLKQVRSPRLGVCLDTAHFFAAGHDLRDKKAIDQLVEQLKQLNILDQVRCLHLNDSQGDFDSGVDQHQNIGQGKIGADGLAYFINHPQLRHLPVILEVPGFSRQGPDKKNIDIVKSLVK